jgi:hypothetical protein
MVVDLSDLCPPCRFSSCSPSASSGYHGIPVLDVDGRIVRGYQPTLIHKLVVDLRQREARAAKDANTG